MFEIGFVTSFSAHLSPTVLLGAGLLLRLSLAAVWLASSTGKFWDLSGTRQALTDFGVPPRHVRAGAIGLPILELLIAWGLLLDGTSSWAGAFSALLALAFVGGLVNLLRQNRRPLSLVWFSAFDSGGQVHRAAGVGLGAGLRSVFSAAGG